MIKEGVFILYSESDLVKIAKRENNNKRKYLVVNPLQGKHVPVSPTETFSLFSQLSNLLANQYDKDSTLVIGFAGTATAIGACVAMKLGMQYVQTTRECLYQADYLFFTESHSHATEQKLVKDGMKETILHGKIKRIVFVEDEVTTGNTILDLIGAMEKEWSDRLQYSVASLLNGMDREALAHFENRGIQVHYLVKTDHRGYEAIANGYREDGYYHDLDCDVCPIECINVQCGIDTRKLSSPADYQAVCNFFWNSMKSRVLPDSSTLVLGTEEFMYPVLYVAKKIEDLAGVTVKFHATTRSPIAVSTEKEYPLHERWELVSLYEKGRKTFVYNLTKYDQVFILTDAEELVATGVYSLVNALVSCGNKSITLVRWC